MDHHHDHGHDGRDGRYGAGRGWREDPRRFFPPPRVERPVVRRRYPTDVTYVVPSGNSGTVSTADNGGPYRDMIYMGLGLLAVLVLVYFLATRGGR